MNVEQLRENSRLLPPQAAVIVAGRVVRETRTVRGVVDSAGRFWTAEQIEAALGSKMPDADRKYLVEVLKPQISEHFVVR